MLSALFRFLLFALPSALTCCRSLPRHPRVRIRRALQTHAYQCTDSVGAKRHALAVDGVRFVDELRNQLRETSSVLQPLGGLVQEIVRINVGIGPTICAVCGWCIHAALP